MIQIISIFLGMLASAFVGSYLGVKCVLKELHFPKIIHHPGANDLEKDVEEARKKPIHPAKPFAAVKRIFMPSKSANEPIKKQMRKQDSKYAVLKQKDVMSSDTQ